MSIKKFFKLVEIQTKVASIVPFILGTFYAVYHFKSFNLSNFIIMFFSLLAFDMATTAINNYIDYKKSANSKVHINNSENIIDSYEVSEFTVLIIIFALLTIATILGIILTFNTNIVVLFIGIISFIIGILYTYGPIPISGMPLGELFSGVFMGFVIIFLSIYIHVYDDNIISVTYKSDILNIGINVVEIFYIFLFSIPAINGIANIMLANNICDVEEDIKDNRFTLPYYLGRPMALSLFKLLYYIGYVDIVILVVIKIVPFESLFILPTLIIVNKNIKLFYNKPIKSETFVLSVKNFVLMNVTQILIMGILIIISIANF